MHAIGWQDIALRLALTVVAGVLIGRERGERDRPAGMRTTLLVCLAASVAMIQANLLLATVGRADSSYVSMDILRLPLGILTGVGFIGAGTILRRDDLVIGVTTAATLWFITVIGLCFGGGQIGLGVAATVLALVVLAGLRAIELRLAQQHLARMTVRLLPDGPSVADLHARLQASGLEVTKVRQTHRNSEGRLRTAQFDVLWRSARRDVTIPPVIDELAALQGVDKLSWDP